MPRTCPALVAVLFSISSVATAADINVPGDADSIQEGIDLAVNGDVVVVGPGRWFESIDLLGKDVTVRSAEGPFDTIIDASETGLSAVHLVSGESAASVLDGFTVTGGSADMGGGVIVDGGAPVITNCLINGNFANFGGGMFVGGGASPLVVNCVLSSNIATGFGMAMFTNQSTPTVVNCTIADNFGRGRGVLLSVASSVHVENTIIWGNAGTEILGVNPVISYSNVQGGWPGVSNISSDPLFRDAPAGDYRLGQFSPCIDAGNNAVIADVESEFEIDIDTDIRANDRMFDDLVVADTGSGGAPVVDMGAIERPTSSDRMVLEPGDPIQPLINQLGQGGMIGVLPGDYEGPIDFEGKPITIVSTGGPGSTTIIPPKEGGGPLVRFTTGEGINSVLDGFTIMGGSAPRGGGMIIDGAQPTILNCIFRDNFAGDDGGAIVIINGAPDIVNCVFIDNGIFGESAPDGAPFGGGAISNVNSSPTITNCTFLRNDGIEVGGGILNDIDSAPRVTNCVLWTNTPDQISGPVTLVSWSNVQGGFAGPNNIDLDPRTVDELGRLGSGSPCIDSADTTAVPTNIFGDVDGAPRFVDDPYTENTGMGAPPVDMGAFEYQGGDEELCLEDLSGNGVVDVADIIELLPVWGECEGCREDLDKTGVVDFGDILRILAVWGPCPQLQIGACCLYDGTCEELERDECIQQEAEYRGDGTDCSSENCEP